MSIDRLKALIDKCPGETWNDKVEYFAIEQCRSRSSIYRWLTGTIPQNTLDAIEFRGTKLLKDPD